MLLARSHNSIRALFDNPLSLHDADHVGATYQERALELGLIKGTVLRRSAMMHLIEGVDGVGLLEARWAGVEEAMKVLSKPLMQGRCSPNLAVNLILMNLLFPSENDFRRALERGRREGKVGNDYHGQRRRKTLTVRRSNPTRYVQARNERDKQVAAEIRRRHSAVLASPDRPTRLTKSFLFACIDGARTIVTKLEQYPQTEATINELAETSEQYIRRRAVWLLRDGKNKMTRAALLKSVRKVVDVPAAELQEMYLRLFGDD